MEGCPVKFRILEVLNLGDMWTDEIVHELQKEYDMGSDHGRNMINYDLVELVSAGMVREGESKVDEDGSFNKGHLLTHYSITKLGESMLMELSAKVNQ